jgi:ABC-type glycerol-3-phosphate transport system substrate-binding protein
LDSKTLNFSAVQNGGTQAITFGKKCYGVALNGTSGVVAGIMYNKDLIAKYAPQYDLQKLYKENKWDFDAFREVAKLCTRDTDGDGKVDTYGVTSNTNIIGIMLTSNAGGTALMKNGRVEATMCNDAGIAALEFCKTLFKTDRSWKYYADIKESVTMFSSGRSAMLATYLHFYTLVAPAANFKFDFVHAPMGPDYGKYVDGVYDAGVFVVPKTNEKKLDTLGTWINHLTTISGELLNIDAKNLAMNGFSNDAIEIFKWCKNNMQADFSTGAFTSAVASQVDNSVTSASKSPAKVMNAIKSQAQAELDDFYANLY